MWTLGYRIFNYSDNVKNDVFDNFPPAHNEDTYERSDHDLYPAYKLYLEPYIDNIEPNPDLSPFAVEIKEQTKRFGETCIRFTDLFEAILEIAINIIEISDSYELSDQLDHFDAIVNEYNTFTIDDYNPTRGCSTKVPPVSPVPDELRTRIENYPEDTSLSVEFLGTYLPIIDTIYGKLETVYKEEFTGGEWMQRLDYMSRFN